MAEFLVENIFRMLTDNGLNPNIEDFGEYTLINVGTQAAFIVAGQSAATPEEAAAQSEAISLKLNQLRPSNEDSDAGQSPKVMVIAEDLWRRKPEMMQARVLAHCGIFDRVFARNCEVRHIDRPQANAFMDANHSYGAASCRHCYGLFTVRRTVSKAHDGAKIIEPGTLVAAAEFSNARRWEKDGREIRSYEWVRYASLPGVRINGGMGKILRRFISDIAPDDIMSYADLEWSDGEVYRHLGFKPDGTKSPVLFSIDPATFARIPLGSRKKSGCPELPVPDSRIIYYRNFGSIKYRLQRL